MNLTSTSNSNASPLDRTRREHTGAIDRVLWADADSQSIGLKLTDGSVVKGWEPAESFSRGVAYRFLGRWEDDAKFGPRFSFDSFVVSSPVTKLGAVKYLSDTCPNVGAKTAEKLWDRYGAECVEILRTEPGRVTEDMIMSVSAAIEASKALRECAAMEQTTIALNGLFVGRGFHGTIYKRAIEKWGAKAPVVIARNPFALLVADMPGAGFKRCDKMWLEMGKPANAIKRQMLCAWNYMRLGNEGHTWYRAEDICQHVMDTIAASAGTDVDPIRAIMLGKRSKWLRTRRDADGRVWVAESEKAVHEQSIADNLKRLLAWDNELLWPDDLPVSQVEGDKLPSPHQREQALRATAATVGILCGGPGTGKTHTLSYILRSVIATVGLTNVRVAAPTGKAAVRATQALHLCGLTDLRATTIHRMLGIGRNGHDGKGWGFIHNRSNPLPVRVLVLDETSMDDCSLMAAVLEACADGTHILFIGDPFQLPPVGHGAPLRDMIASGVVPVGELREVRRNAGAIVHACVRIKAGEQFDTYEDYDPSIGHNLMFAETSNENESVEVLERILTSMKQFDPVWSTQVLCGVNAKSPLSRTAINDRLHKLLNPNGHEVTGNPFRVGDKVICLRNGEYVVVEPREDDLPEESMEDADSYVETSSWQRTEFGSMENTGEPEMAYCANGEQARVVAISAKATIVRVGEGDVLVRIPMKKKRDAGEDQTNTENEQEAKGRQSEWDLAYAITVHKSQGSESPCVVIMADKAASRVAERHFWYTAVSRASRLCIIIGQRGVVRQQCLRQALVKRRTFLESLIREGAAGNQ